MKAELATTCSNRYTEQDKNIPNLHDISLGKNRLNSPSGELAAVVLHLSGDYSTTLRHKLGPPVKATTAALSLAVKLVESVDSDELVLVVESALLHRIQLGADDKISGALLGGGKIEPSVLVGLGRRGHGLLGGVEGVLVSHADLVLLKHNLVGKVVVDIGSLLRERGGLVDRILGSLGSLERRIGGVLVDGDHVKSGVVALVKEDLVALSDNDDIPRVDGTGGAHQHRENAISGEDGGLLLVSELLDDRIHRGRDVVGSTVKRKKLALRVLDWWLVVGAVVGIYETVAVDILTLVRLEVQLAKTVVVNLLKQGPVGLDVDRSITVASRLVVILPAKATTAASIAATAGTAPAVIASAILPTATGTLELLTTTGASGISPSTALATAATGENGTTAETGLG